MDHLQRLRYVTERYEQLQGLRLVPLGIPFLVSSVWRSGQLAWIPWTSGAGARIWFVTLVAAAVVLSIATKTYYGRRFGDVQSAVTMKAPMAGFVFIGLFIVSASRQPDVQTVSIPAVILALGLGYVGTAGGLLRSHYLAVAACVAIFAVLGMLGIPFHTRDVLWDQLSGMAFIVIGVGDHLLLRRMLAPGTHVNAL